MAPPDLVCEFCKSHFPARKARTPPRFCNVVCARRAPRPWMRGSRPSRPGAFLKRKCAQCRESFIYRRSETSRKFCSYPCRFAFRRFERRAFNCKRCGKEVVRALTARNRRSRSVFCSRKCAAVLNRGSVQLRSGNIGSDNKRAKVVLLSEGITACQRCGYNTFPEILELHHVDRNRNNRRRENLLILCPNCHTLDHFRARDGSFSANLGRKDEKKDQ